MNKYFFLKHFCGFEITRPVCDMAAFFGYELRDEADISLQINFADDKIQADLSAAAQKYSCQILCQAEQGSEIISGEVTRCVKLAVLQVFSQFTGVAPELPWGILTGVRPGKLAHKLLDNGVATEKIAASLHKKYLLPVDKGELLKNIAVKQKQVLCDSTRWQDVGVYIGIPYCPSRCSYCSFPAGIVPADEESQQNFLNLIEQDIKNVVQLLSMHSLSVRSLYIGGGTPTCLNDNVFARLVNLVRKHLRFADVDEFTVEAGRPDCFSKAKLAAMEAVGVNRISVNPQTFHDKTLQLIGRRHSVVDFYRAYEDVRHSKIPVVNMDLIIGLPGETAAEISFSLHEAVKLAPENLTIHTLTLKRNAPLFGSAMSLSAQAAADLVEEGKNLAIQAGLEPYYLYRQHYMLGHLANIGYSKPGMESIYNIQMMEERHPVIGVGPSSSTKLPLSDGHHLRHVNMPKNVAVYGQNLPALLAKRASIFN